MVLSIVSRLLLSGWLGIGRLQCNLYLKKIAAHPPSPPISSSIEYIKVRRAAGEAPEAHEGPD